MKYFPVTFMAVLIPLVVFAAFAFSNATFSIQYWEKEARDGCAYLMFCGAVLGGVAGCMFQSE